MNQEQDSGLTRSSVPLARRRDKPRLSCNLCRKRKMRCDRGRPCQTCIKRGLSLSCSYLETSDSNSTRRAPLGLQDRIGQLENLVALQLRNQTKKANDSGDRPPIGDLDLMGHILTNRIGTINVKDDETTWVESDHWTAILDGIGELKDSVGTNQGDEYLSEGDMSPVPEPLGPELLLGANKHISKVEVIASIPQRSTVDRLLSQFLKSVDVAPMVLHIPTFLEEYEQFWDHPEQTPILWIGLLYAIMCLAVLQQHFGFDSTIKDCTDNKLLAQTYRVKVSQCLVLGRYTEPSRYVIEALLLYMHIEHFQSKDAQTGLWILLGITLRLALRMGYHRDAVDFSPISPFHAEMRRRAWCVLSMMDAGAAAQFGLPRMLRASQANTAEPRNLLDEDLRQDLIDLPSARPLTHQTPVQYFVAKNRIISVSGSINEIYSRTKPPKYAEIIALDGALQGAYESMPQRLAIRPMSQCILDGPLVILQRIFLVVTFLKAKCTLHQPYIKPAKTNGCYSFSRTACLDAASEMLRLQQIVDEETQPGGRLHADRGKIPAMMQHDFLLATMMLCADLSHDKSAAPPTRPDALSEKPRASGTVSKALEKAYSTWRRSGNISREAQQATNVLKAILDKDGTSMTTSEAPNPTPPYSITGLESSSNDFGLAFDPLLFSVSPRNEGDRYNRFTMDFDESLQLEHDCRQDGSSRDLIGESFEDLSWDFSADERGNDV